MVWSDVCRLCVYKLDVEVRHQGCDDHVELGICKTVVLLV